MNERFKKLFADTIIAYLMMGTLVTVSLSFLLTILFFKKLPPFIPLFNQQPWGEAQLGKNIEIFLPILLALVVFICNAVFSSFLYEKMPLTARLLCTTSLFIGLFSLLLIIRILLVIT